ncbi:MULTISPECIES: hypothetical protein [Cyanophyceae]|uniref:hypothetical protein n=1 Tax=Cyanophyceae TaxID=3028117 RepID=UPI00016DCED1|nr:MULTISPECIES: hypothetical protein [Cyanophyceae]ACB00984.1 hypothetical protein SYNPCC7002_F0053 [Picosynechococcus sp. PCC 7002]SMH58439.1 hypothetical protein SAMN06272755_3186 [Picosynechococcus sp. OG1]SMQ86434.1 hypothetical protein SAMN06272774_3178 [Synechococcus sp. 7002]
MIKNLFRFFAASSFGLTLFFCYWTYRDYVELVKAVEANQPQAELRHRINVGFDGTWALMCAMTMVYSIGKLGDRQP